MGKNKKLQFTKLAVFRFNNISVYFQSKIFNSNQSTCDMIYIRSRNIFAYTFKSCLYQKQTPVF